MKIMAVDYGDARTGLAVCDRTEFLASPVGTIEEKSFAGIYVDKRAYDEEGFVSLDASLKAELDCEPINSANGNLYFYEF